MSRIFALVVGTSFFVAGLMGLLQEPLVSDGLLHDVFAVNPMHDAIRLAVGMLGVLAYTPRAGPGSTARHPPFSSC